MIEYTVKVYDGGNRFWYMNGVRHREDGPAFEYANGTKEWYLNGKEFTEEEFLQMTQKHVIIIDGQEIQISEESYKELQKSLK